jgi:phosphoesterase RecJ-like protein
VDSPLNKIVSLFSQAKKLLLVTHARPDGDTLGSALALALAARAQGKEADVCVIDAVPLRYEFLFDRVKPVGPEQFDRCAGEADVVAIIDCSVFTQLDGLEQSLRSHAGKVVVIDHHSTPQRISAHQWIDSSAAAAGVLAGELIAALGWPLDFEIAQALLTAITSDTGWFQFANTDPRCLDAAARCLEAGVRTDHLYTRLFQCDRPQRLALLARVLSSMELYCNNRLAVCTIHQTDFDQTGARPDETENLVNESLRMGCVETAILLVQNPSGTPVRAVSVSVGLGSKQGEETHGQDAHPTQCGTPVQAVQPIVRVSLRSRDALDVAVIARQFGGGGHGRAAGFRKDEDIDLLKGKLIEVCTQELKKAGLC